MSGFKKAERKQVKFKAAMTGPSGAGKTFSALLIAKGLATHADGTIGKIALIDTENESASLYAGLGGMPDFDTMTIGAPFLTTKYLDAIKQAAKEGYEVLVIDSISHQWSGEGGIMDRMDKEKMAKPGQNSYTMWAKFTPEHEAFKSAIVQAPLHIISTMRSKQDYVLQTNEKGKQTPQKVGMAPIQRDQFEYEFTTVFDLSMEHYATASKDRTHLFDGQCFKPAAETGERVLAWLKSGKEPDPIPAGTTAAAPSAHSAPPPVITPPRDQAPKPPAIHSRRGLTKDQGAVSDAQIKRLYAISHGAQWTEADLKAYLDSWLGISSTTEIHWKDYEPLCTTISNMSYTAAMAALGVHAGPRKVDVVTEKDRQAVIELAGQMQWPTSNVQAHMVGHWGKTKVTDLTRAEYDALVNHLKTTPAPAPREPGVDDEQGAFGQFDGRTA